MDSTIPLPFGQPRDATVQHLREMAATRVQHTSLRGVAREIGMSPTGLKKFLLGTAPYAPTLRRLRKWYVHHAAVPTGEVAYDDASAAIAVLTHDLPGEPRRETASVLLDCLRRGYEATGRAHRGGMAERRDEIELRGGS